jgi:hypothetical protein
MQFCFLLPSEGHQSPRMPVCERGIVLDSTWHIFGSNGVCKYTHFNGNYREVLLVFRFGFCLTNDLSCPELNLGLSDTSSTTIAVFSAHYHVRICQFLFVYFEENQ